MRGSAAEITRPLAPTTRPARPEGDPPASQDAPAPAPLDDADPLDADPLDADPPADPLDATPAADDSPLAPAPAAPPAWFLALTRAIWRRPARWWRPLDWAAALLLLAAVLVPIGPGSNDLFAAASAARAVYRYDRALAFYTQAARLHPRDPRPACLTGDVLALQRLAAPAIAAYQRCQALGDSDPNVWLAMGDVELARGAPDTAVSDWRRAAASGSWTAHRRLAALYESQGRLDLAAAQWHALPTTDDQALTQLGLIALSLGDYPTAQRDLVAARQLGGYHAQDALDQGFVLLAAAAPQDEPDLAQLGFTFLQNDMPTFARAPLERAIAADPTAGPPHAYLAWVEMLAGETAPARADETIALQLDPSESFTLFVAGEQAMAARDWQTAIDQFSAATESDKSNPLLWSELGRAYLGEYGYVQAELNLDQGANLGDDPSYSVALLQFYVDYQVGIYDGRAAHAANVALGRWPTSAAVRDLAGQIYTLMGQTDQAEAIYERTVEVDPGDPRAYIHLGRYALQHDDLVTAAGELRTALAISPDGPLAPSVRALLAPLAGVAV